MSKKKQKQISRQRSQMNRKQKRRIKEKKVLNAKRRGQEKPILKKVTDKKKSSLKERIMSYFFKAIRRIKRLICFIGIHDFKLCSGLEGDSKFTCIKCWKGSRKKWGPGGSTEHYEEKMKEQNEIADPKNWEKKEGKYYFKGKYVNLKEEETKRLDIILKEKKK